MISFYLSMIETPSDKDKFEDIYSRYRLLMFYVANSETHNRDYAEDIVQETFVKIIRNLSIIRTDKPGEISSLIAIMTKRTAIDYLRKEKNYYCCETIENIPEPDGYNPETQLINLSKLNEVKKALAEMDSKYSDPLKLFVLGYKTNEIASLLDLEPNTVKVRIYRARKMLKESVGE